MRCAMVLAHEIVIDHFMQVVVFRRRQRQRDEQVDVDQDALLAFLFEFVHADIDQHFVIAQEQAAAVGQAGVGQEGAAWFRMVME